MNMPMTEKWMLAVVKELVKQGAASDEGNAREKIYNLESQWQSWFDERLVPREAVEQYVEFLNTTGRGKPTTECTNFDRFMNRILISESHRFKK